MPFQNLMVTGGCGFIGANFIRFLLERPDFRGRIINVDALTYAGNPENLAGVAERYPDRYVFHKADICDAGALKGLFDREDIDAVCHFAAESHVDRSIKRPEGFIFTNIVGTFNLLEAARTRGDAFRLLHHVSTDEVYGSLGPEGLFTETTPYHPNSPYSASKAASDHLVRAYHETYRLPVTLSNCSNNYGPYQFPEKLIPHMIQSALAGRPLPVYGDGGNVRDWLFVGDHCRALLAVMDGGRPGETYAIGGDSERTNLQVVRGICSLLDEMSPRADGAPYEKQVTFVPDRPGHDRRYAIDAGKIASELGWRPQVSFDDGLRTTVRWYLDNAAWVRSILDGDYRMERLGLGGTSR